MPTLGYILAPMGKLRFDYVDLNVIKTDEGYLLDSPNVARTGILVYRNDDGTIRRELRLPEDVFHEDSLNSFKGKPITVDHPKGLVGKSNVDKYQVGTMLSPGRKDGDNAKVDIVIHQSDKIGDRRQLSLGYNVDLEETPGEWNGQKYDAIQRNIRVNHLSVVKSARAGAQARLNMDSDEEPLLMELVDMPKIRLDTGIEYEAAPEVIVHIEKMRTDATAQAEVIKSKDTEIGTLKGAKDTLQARVDAFPTELAKAEKIAKESVEARSSLEKVAATFKVDSKDKTDDQIKHAVIKTFNKDFNPEGKSLDYVNAAFDIAIAQRNDSALQSQRKQVTGDLQNRNDKQDDPYEAYRKSLGSNSVNPKE